MKHTFIRENSLERYNCRYKTVGWDVTSEKEDLAKRQPRQVKTRTTLPRIKKLNDDHSRAYFEWLLQNNFSRGDLHVTLTFAKIPRTLEVAKREFSNYIKRLRRLYARSGIPLDYIYVLEGKPDGDKAHPRLHYHLVLRGGVQRDDIERLWKCGLANCDSLQPDASDGLAALARYLAKSRKSAEKYERVWNCSQGLKRPDKVTDDNKITKKMMRGLLEAKRNDEVKKYLARIYVGWMILSADVGVNEVTGRPYARIRMMRRERYAHYIKLYRAIMGKSPP